MLTDQGQGEVNLIKNSKMLYYDVFQNSFFFFFFPEKPQTLTCSGFSDPIPMGWVDEKELPQTIK